MRLGDFMVIFFTNICALQTRYHAKVIDICNSPTKNLNLNVDSSGIISTWNLITKTDGLSKCQVELVTCPFCMILAKIQLLDLTKMSKTVNDLYRTKNSCNADRLEIEEPLYKIHVRKLFCPTFDRNGAVSEFTYRSQTKSIAINFFYGVNYTHPFTLEYFIKRNIRNFEILPDYLENTVTSPFFPVHYPSDYRAQYNIKCSSKIKENCRIKIFFLDYQIAHQSLLEFFENRAHRIGLTSGRIFRPPIIISSGRTLSINFYANKASSFGFKFNYSAILGEDNSVSLKPETNVLKLFFDVDCGGYIEDLGGTIIMTKMTSEFKTVSFDCVWIIKPTQGNYFKSHLLVKIISFLDMGDCMIYVLDNILPLQLIVLDQISLEHHSKLEIHEGLTSGHKRAKHISFQRELNFTILNEELVGSMNMGFYIYLHALFNSRSQFIVSYSAFSFSNFHETENFVDSVEIPLTTEVCYIVSDFLCRNHRCISGHLRCDGFDHCGDNSDESNCAKTGEEYHHQQNYYFPKIESFSYIPTGLIYAIFTIFSIFLLCSLISTLLYRTQQPYELNRTLGTLNQMIAENRTRNGDDFNEITSNQEPPPRYESPPNYQEIMEMQIFLDNQANRIKKPKCLHNRSTCREFRNTAITGCSHSLIKNTNQGCMLSSSSDDDSPDADEIKIKKAAHYAEHSFDSITSNESNAAMRNDKPTRIKKANKIYSKMLLKNKMKILLSKSANNLVHDNSNNYCNIRLSRSVEGLSSQLKSINRDFCTDESLENCCLDNVPLKGKK